MCAMGQLRAEGLGLFRFSLALAAAAGAAVPALADDDDKKLLDRQPMIRAPIYRNADAWKLLSLSGPISGHGDETFPSKNIILSSWLPVNTFPGYSTSWENQSAADCWGYTSPSGREYALLGLGWGTAVVEVTNPESPSILTTIAGPDTLWHDVEVVGHYAYAVTDSVGVGIQVIDLSDVDNGNATLVRNFAQGGHTKTHTILANPDSGYLYLCGGNAAAGGMIAASTSPDPTFPTFVGTGWRNQYVHEAQIVTYTEGPYAGREIAFLFAAGPYYGSSYTTAFAIADVTDKENIVTLSQIAYPGMRFCHQGWLTEDRKYLYVNDELDSPGSTGVPRFLCRVFDVSDLEHPRLISTFTNGLPAVDHNEYVKGRYLYQSNYTTGLRIWDIVDPLRPVEVAFIDTRPEDDATTYNGAWGNYPFFESGTILISDIERGLFVVKLSLLEFTPASELPTVLTPGQPTAISVQLAQINAEFGSAQIMVSVNGGAFAPYPMQLQSGMLSGQIPAVACLDRVAYYIKTTTTDEREFTWPLQGEAAAIAALAHDDQIVVFHDDFETGTGWTVSNSSGLSGGAWVRDTPLYNGGPGAVIGDADGSGKCFMTGNTFGSRVAGGTTRLISPTFDLAQHPEARITYSRWFFSIVGTTDTLITEVSANNGSTWTIVDTVGPVTGGWREHSFRIADYITPSAQTRVRIRTTNTDSSTTEAGVDAFRITVPTCAPCYANCDGSTAAPILNVADFTCFLTKFAAGDPYANCDGSTVEPVLNVADFSCFLTKFAAGCP
jgi:choice-of-anchor B domain-containing protein